MRCKCAQKNKDIIDEHIGSGNDGLDGFNQTKTWALKTGQDRLLQVTHLSVCGLCVSDSWGIGDLIVI